MGLLTVDTLFALLSLPLTVGAAPVITQVATSDKQWTGVAVSRAGRIFVCYPTWNDYPEGYRVAELVDGVPRPFPSEAVNREFVCVQSVVADDRDHLWILDPAKLKRDLSPPQERGSTRSTLRRARCAMSTSCRRRRPCRRAI